MVQNGLTSIVTEMKSLRSHHAVGRVSAIGTDGIKVVGLTAMASIGDAVRIKIPHSKEVGGEVVGIDEEAVHVLPYDSTQGISLGNRVALDECLHLSPTSDWIGRVIDPNGRPIDGLPIAKGTENLPLNRPAPAAVFRKGLGARCQTGYALLNTLLPIVRGQRVGLFAGSGVGKTTLMAGLASKMDADVVVIALIGERGREVGEFVRDHLGEEGMARAIVVAATSDQSALLRRQCAYSAMTIAEYFRDLGKSVLYLADSVTRLAEAHREVAVSSGEPPSLRGHPPSMTSRITSLCERAGPGIETSGDITAIFTVLVAGSDMEEPVADTLRGVLDGHIVLDRKISERGRFPAIDVVRSISRSLPNAATDTENSQIGRARKLLSAYSQSETMIKAGLYNEGTDRVLDQAVRVHEDFEKFFQNENLSVDASFQALSVILRAADAYLHASQAKKIRR